MPVGETWLSGDKLLAGCNTLKGELLDGGAGEEREIKLGNYHA
jgi:hypothetical protein